MATHARHVPTVPPEVHEWFGCCISTWTCRWSRTLMGLGLTAGIADCSVISTTDFSSNSSASLQWQPCSVDGPDSRWLIAGQYALDSETLATKTLGIGGGVSWVVWCPDGVHAVLLDSSLPHAALSVFHVPSRRLTASLGCIRAPDLGRNPLDNIPGEHSPGMYVSCEARAALVPVSLQAVSLCKLPGLDTLAQLVGPTAAGKAMEFLCMGWAAGGSLIAITWRQAHSALAVTVYSGSNGDLCHTLSIQATPPYSPQGNKFSLQGFAVCPDQPAAAIAWRDWPRNYVVHLNLATGTHVYLKRPFGQQPNDSCYDTGPKEYEFIWAPQGRHLRSDRPRLPAEAWTGPSLQCVLGNGAGCLRAQIDLLNLLSGRHRESCALLLTRPLFWTPRQALQSSCSTSAVCTQVASDRSQSCVHLSPEPGTWSSLRICMAWHRGSVIMCLIPARGAACATSCLALPWSCQGSCPVARWLGTPR